MTRAFAFVLLLPSLFLAQAASLGSCHTCDATNPWGNRPHIHLSLMKQSHETTCTCPSEEGQGADEKDDEQEDTLPTATHDHDHDALYLPFALILGWKGKRPAHTPYFTPGVLLPALQSDLLPIVALVLLGRFHDPPETPFTSSPIYLRTLCILI